MSLGNLFFWEILNPFNDRLIAHIQNDQLGRYEPVLDLFLCVLGRIFSFYHRNAHKYLACVLVGSRKPVQNISPVEAIILSQPPFVTLVDEFLAKTNIHSLRVKRFKRIT